MILFLLLNSLNLFAKISPPPEPGYTEESGSHSVRILDLTTDTDFDSVGRRAAASRAVQENREKDKRIKTKQESKIQYETTDGIKGYE